MHSLFLLFYTSFFSFVLIESISYTSPRNLLEVVPFEVLPVHERLHQEARLSKKKYDRKMESEGLVGKPAIEPPKVLRKSKQILSLSPNKRESLVNKEKELSRSNISLRFESPRGMRRTQDPEKPLELDRSVCL